MELNETHECDQEKRIAISSKPRQKWYEPNNDTWNIRFQELVEYKKLYGHTNVPRRKGANTTLGTWVDTQRYYGKRHLAGKLNGTVTIDRYAKLHQIGFDFYPRKNQKEKAAQKQEEGGVQQPEKQFVPTAPTKYELLLQETLAKSRQREADKAWNDRYNELVEFKEEHGHIDVPWNYTENRRLVNWIQKQREYYGKRHVDGFVPTSTTLERYEKLLKVGFFFYLTLGQERDTTPETASDTFEQPLEDVVPDFLEKTKHLQEKINSKSAATATEKLNSQKTCCPSNFSKVVSPQDDNNQNSKDGEKIQELLDNDIEQSQESSNHFDLVNTSNDETKEEDNNTEEVGNKSPKKKSSDPTNSVKPKRVRKRRPRPPRPKKPKTEPSLKAQQHWFKPDNEGWNARYQELLEFKEKHGHLKVPWKWPENKSLAWWIRTQRKLGRLHLAGKLKSMASKERYEKLRQIGFDFFPTQKHKGVVPATAAEAYEKSLEDTLGDYLKKADAIWKRLNLEKMATKESRSQLNTPLTCLDPSSHDDGRRQNSECSQQKQKAMDSDTQQNEDSSSLIDSIDTVSVDNEIDNADNFSSNESGDQLNPAHSNPVQKRQPSTKNSSEPPAKRFKSNGDCWNIRYNDLVQFKKEHGHTDVPHTYAKNKPLVNWVTRQRAFGKLHIAGELNGMVTPERYEKLRKIGFNFFPRLKKKKKKAVPATSAKALIAERYERKDASQRTASPSTLLEVGPSEVHNGQNSTNQQKQPLTNNNNTHQIQDSSTLINFDTNKNDAEVDDSVNHFLKKSSEPSGDTETELVQNKQSSTEKGLKPRAQWLKPHWLKPDDETWNTRYQELLEFKERHGHTNVPWKYAENVRLANWVRTQRKYGKLYIVGSPKGVVTKERYEKPRQIGFNFFPQIAQKEAVPATTAEADEKSLEDGLASYLKKADRMRKKLALKKMMTEKARPLNSNPPVPSDPAHREDDISPYSECSEQKEELEDDGTHHVEYFSSRIGSVDKTENITVEDEMRNDCNAFSKETSDPPNPIQGREVQKSNASSKNSSYDELWDARYKELIQFKEKHGHTNVTRNYAEYRQLANWVVRQRLFGRDHVLGLFNRQVTKERYEKLHQIGFDFFPRRSQKKETIAIACAGSDKKSSGDNLAVEMSVGAVEDDLVSANSASATKKPDSVSLHDASHWRAYFEQLVQFKSEYGHCNVPSTYVENPLLGKWVLRVRKAAKRFLAGRSSRTITQERIDKLRKIGFMFEVRRSWDEHFRMMEEYKEKHGHANVPKVYQKDPPLGLWVERQRYNAQLFEDGIHDPKYPLTQEQYDKLVKIGLKWENSSIKSWNENYQLLKKYTEEHGNCNLPFYYDELYLWADKVHKDVVKYLNGLQRGGTLNSLMQDRLERLQAIDFFSGRSITVKRKPDAANEE